MSRFTYIPADKTDLRESMKRYRKMVEDENRRLHSGEREASSLASSPNPPGREILGQQKQGLQRLRVVTTGGQS